MSTERFFSKANIYPTIWAIVVGLLAFIGGLIWKNWTGPDEVVVLNRNLNEDQNKRDTSITIIKFQPDDKYLETLTKLTTKKAVSQQLSTDKSKTKKEIDSISFAIAKEYQAKFDSLALTVTAGENLVVSDKLSSKPESNNGSGSIQVKRPKFRMPSMVEGYTHGKLNSYASVVINNYEFKRNETVVVQIEFFNQSTLEKITPLYVDIVEPKTENSVYFVWGEQYEVKDLKSTLTFSADFKPGKYQLTIGFYLMKEIERKYPTLFQKQFDIVIK